MVMPIEGVSSPAFSMADISGLLSAAVAESAAASTALTSGVIAGSHDDDASGGLWLPLMVFPVVVAAFSDGWCTASRLAFG